MDEVVFHLNGDFRYSSSCNLSRLLLFGMTKRENGQFLVDNGGVWDQMGKASLLGDFVEGLCDITALVTL